jgi:hypothetical protein
MKKLTLERLAFAVVNCGPFPGHDGRKDIGIGERFQWMSLVPPDSRSLPLKADTGTSRDLVHSFVRQANMGDQPVRRAGYTGSPSLMRTTGPGDSHPYLFSHQYQEHPRFAQAMQLFLEIGARHDCPARSSTAFVMYHRIPFLVLLSPFEISRQVMRNRSKSDSSVVRSTWTASWFVLQGCDFNR